VDGTEDDTDDDENGKDGMLTRECKNNVRSA
jgi:hypothetical protein